VCADRVIESKHHSPYRQRSLLRRLEYDCAPCRNCRRYLHGKAQRGNVPWNDGSDRSNRLPECHVDESGSIQTRLPLDFIAHLGMVLEHIRSDECIEERGYLEKQEKISLSVCFFQ